MGGGASDSEGEDMEDSMVTPFALWTFAGKPLDLTVACVSYVRIALMRQSESEFVCLMC